MKFIGFGFFLMCHLILPNSLFAVGPCGAPPNSTCTEEAGNWFGCICTTESRLPKDYCCKLACDRCPPLNSSCFNACSKYSGINTQSSPAVENQAIADMIVGSSEGGVESKKKTKY